MSKDGTVPITRDYLRDFYKDRPALDLSPDVEPLSRTLEQITMNLSQVFQSNNTANLPNPKATTYIETPRRLDETHFRFRQIWEETSTLYVPEKVAQLLPVVQGKSAENAESWRQTAQGFHAIARHGFETIVTFQNWHRAHIEKFANQFIPTDGIRASYVRSKREATEKKYAEEMAALDARNASLKERYDKLWEQQLERRQQLVDLGNASGFYKMVLKMIGGVPQALLDFLKTLNSPEGPTEELRIKYAPACYSLFRLGNNIQLVSSLFVTTLPHLPWDGSDTSIHSLTGILDRAFHLCTREMDRYYAHLQDLYKDAPIFISAEDAAAATVGENSHEVKVKNGKTLVVPVKVAAAGAVVAWDFQTKKHDISFGVTFEAEGSSSQTVVIPNARVRCDTTLIKGEHQVTSPGTFRLTWDNTYSSWTSKELRYRVYVVEQTELAADSAGSRSNSSTLPPPRTGSTSH